MADLLTRRNKELAALISGVCKVLASAQYRDILHSYPTEALDSMDRMVNPLPRPPLLEGPDEGAVFARLAAVISRLGYRVEAVDAPNANPDANGVTWHSRQLVQINRTRSPLHQAKTAAHELAHIALHGPGPGPLGPRRVRELQAETFAWVLMRRLGIDSGSFSFAFIAKYGAVRQGTVLRPGWALGHALDDVTPVADWALLRMPAMEPVT